MTNTTLATTLGQGTSLFDLFDQAVRDPDRADESAGILRALARPLVHAIAKMRQEALAPFEQRLQYFARYLTGVIEDKGLPENSAEYLLGRVDALLDLCAVGIDRSLSDEVLQQARRSHAHNILRAVAQTPAINVSALVLAVGIGQTYMSNILRWMEAAELIRRVESGRSVLVSLGPKGEAALAALDAERSQANLGESDQIAASDPAATSSAGAPEPLLAAAQGQEEVAAPRVGNLVLRLLSTHHAEDTQSAAVSVTDRIHSVIDEADSSSQWVLRRGVVHAISGWSPSSHAAHVLEQLAELATALRMVEAALPLIAAVERTAQGNQPPSAEFSSALSAIVRTLAALGPSPDVEVACLRLLGRGLDAELAKHAFIALVRCEPSKYPAHFERFYELTTSAQSPDARALVACLLEAVPMEILLRELPGLSHASCAVVVEGLFGGAEPFARVEAERRSVQVFDRTRQRIQLDYSVADRARIHTLLSKYIPSTTVLLDDIAQFLRASNSTAVGSRPHTSRGPIPVEYPRSEFVS